MFRPNCAVAGAPASSGRVFEQTLDVPSSHNGWSFYMSMWTTGRRAAAGIKRYLACARGGCSHLLFPVAAWICVVPLSLATEPETPERSLEEIRVVATALSSGTVNLALLPFAAQRFDSTDLATGALFSAVELLEDRATGVSSNAAQNNRLQPDLQYRGFTASPLLGLSQGLAVYQNGVRINEAFGDTVNWDLISASSIDSMDLVGGSNPVFGLNTFGGALTLRGKTGFSHPDGTVAITLGDYNTRDVSASWGGHNETLGITVAFDQMKEDGWRDFSASEAQTAYAALSWRGDTTEADLFLHYGDSDLKGNGSVPLDLLNANRRAVFTHPDQTQNRLAMASASLRHRLDANHELSVSAFYRDLETLTFNGDGTEYEECGEDEEDAADHGSENEDPENPFEGLLCTEAGVPVTDVAGNVVDEDFNAINNRSRRKQASYGGTLQLLGRGQTGTVGHQYLLGLDLFEGETDFASSVEFSALTDTRGTVLTGRFDSDGFTNLTTDVQTWSVFAADNAELNQNLSLSVSARYNRTRSQGVDPTGARPELAGDHRFENFNLGAGLLWAITDTVAFYGNVQNSTRTPTPVELACSHPDAPCTLPNSFLADPPLEDVRSSSLEAGVRGSAGAIDSYRIGGFLIRANDDIVFQTTGGISSNEGFFQNAADTQRLGLELELAGGGNRWDWYLNYTWMEATFESPFTASSPNNPAADDGLLAVAPGADIPLLPDHNLKLGASTRLVDGLLVGMDFRYQDGIHLRGDEANLDEQTDAWHTIDLYARISPAEWWFAEARVDNLLNEEYETFGLYGEADEVLEDVQDNSGRFLGPAPPRIWWLTVGLRF